MHARTKAWMTATAVVTLTVAGGLTGLLGAVAVAQDGAAKQRTDPYDVFNKFCIEHFGAEKEEEVYLKFGKELKVLKDGSWRHVSEASACIAWETNLPAKTYVEYGLTNRYGHKTPPPERHFYLHVHYLKELKPDTTYHYRLVSVDERGGRATGKDRTFTTRRLEGAVRVPGDLPGPPYVLDKANTVYLVTQDIVSDTTVFNIAAHGITLDLGGHTIVYDDKAGAKDPSAQPRGYGWAAVQGPCGIRTADNRSDMKILNGTIRQGKGKGASKPSAYNPIFLRRPRNTEVAGVTVEYVGSQVTGIVVDSAYDGVHVHHNVVVDRGTELYNRHRGLDGIKFNVEKTTTSLKCHHNLIKRTRHRGIKASANTELFANEIYIDSWATNSCGILYWQKPKKISRNLTLHRNRIFGTGFHPIGIGSGASWHDVKITDNFIQMQGTKREERWKGGAGGGGGGTLGAGGVHPISGIRLQDARGNIQHTGNVVVVKGKGKGCMMRGIWVVQEDRAAKGLLFRNNRVKLIAEDRNARGYAIAAGGVSRKGSAVVSFEGNVVITNLGHVQFNDNYSHGGKYRFVGNTFVKVGNDPRYKTIRMGWEQRNFPSFGHVFIDSQFEGGANYDSISFDGARRARYEFSVTWTLVLKAAPGARVTIRDKTGALVFSGDVPANAKLSVPLVQYLRKRDGREPHTPHTLTIDHGGKTTTRTLTMDQSREIDLRAQR